MQTTTLLTRRVAHLVGVFLLTLALTPAAQADEPVHLQPQFVAGRTSRYELWTFRKQEVIMSLGARSQTTGNRMEVTGEVTWTIDSVADDGSATCTMTLDWMIVTLLANDGSKQTNDSRQGSGDTEKVHRLIEAMCGAPLTVTVAADGTVTAIDGVDAIRAAAGDDVKVPQDLDFIETASDLVAISQSPTDLAAGESFPATYEWSHDMGMMRHEGEYTLAGVELVADIPIATVNGLFDLTLEPDTSKLGLPADAPSVDISFNGGKVVTAIMFDLQRGEAVGRNTMQTSSITITMGVRNETLTRTINELVQSQVLRIAE